MLTNLRRFVHAKRFDRSNRVLKMLQDGSIDEDDKPDYIKDLLLSLLVLPANVRPPSSLSLRVAPHYLRASHDYTMY